MADVPSEQEIIDSLSAENVPPIGRTFWVYRSSAVQEAAALTPAMVNRTFATLEAEFAAARKGPIGLAVLIADRDEMHRHPEAIWPETELLFAGYTEDDVQVRIRYFEDATIGPGLPNSPTEEESRRIAATPIGDSYRIEPLGAGSAVTADDVVALWKRENVMPEPEARRRAGEVALVAIERTAGVVGVSTAFIEPNARLRADAWYIRGYVSKDHRGTNLATQFLLRTTDLLEHRYVSGEDTRASAIVLVVENKPLMTFFNRAVWMPVGFAFIGESATGSHVRVRHLAGATAPLPT